MEKGQKVLVVTIGNAARYGSKIYKAEIAAVGRKYFTLTSEETFSLDRVKFRKEDLREETNYSSNYKVYLSVEDYNEEIERPILYKEVENLLKVRTCKELIKIREFINTL